MKKYLIIGITLVGISLGADELVSFQEAQKKVEQAKENLLALKEENQKLRLSAETLEKAAQVTLAPSANPRAEKRAVETEVIFQNPLDSEKGFEGTKGKIEVIVLDGRKVFKLSNPGAECARITLSVPENSMILVACMVKGENIKETRPNGGSRVGAYFNVNDKAQWPSAKALTGSFDWLNVSFKTSLPVGCDKITLLLGIAGGEGTVYLRDLTVERVR